MLGNRKNAFWEALLIAGIIFILGLLLGLFLESNRLQQTNDYYSQAEVSLMDSVALSNSINIGQNCQNLINSNLEFADKIYNEARVLEQYEDSGKISDSLKIAHSKYDLLRTILWQNIMKIEEKCPNQFNSIIYLYVYDPASIHQKATQNVWSNILYEVKQQQGSNLILVPIATDGNLSSLNYLIREFNVTSFPAVIVNDKKVLYNLTTSVNLEKELTNPQ
jgi:hypothetical protein